MIFKKRWIPKGPKFDSAQKMEDLIPLDTSDFITLDEFLHTLLARVNEVNPILAEICSTQDKIHREEETFAEELGQLASFTPQRTSPSCDCPSHVTALTKVKSLRRQLRAIQRKKLKLRKLGKYAADALASGKAGADPTCRKGRAGAAPEKVNSGETLEGCINSIVMHG